MDNSNSKGVYVSILDGLIFVTENFSAHSVVGKCIKSSILLAILFICWYLIGFLKKIFLSLVNKKYNDAFFMLNIIQISPYTLRFILCITILEHIAIVIVPNKSFATTINSISSILIVVVLNLFVLKIIKLGEVIIEKRTIEGANELNKDITLDKGTLDILSKLLAAIWLMISIIWILQVLGFSFQGIMAFGGLSGVIIAVAARDLIGAIIGTISIYFDRQFRIGETIKVLDRFYQPEGVVEKIDWRVTRIRTADKKAVYIPNILFVSIPVENSSHVTLLRIVLHATFLTIDLDVVQAIIIQLTSEKIAYDAGSLDMKVDIENMEVINKSIRLKCSMYIDTQDRTFIGVLKFKIFQIFLNLCSDRNIGLCLKFD